MGSSFPATWGNTATKRIANTVVLPRKSTLPIQSNLRMQIDFSGQESYITLDPDATGYLKIVDGTSTVETTVPSFAASNAPKAYYVDEYLKLPRADFRSDEFGNGKYLKLNPVGDSVNANILIDNSSLTLFVVGDAKPTASAQARNCFILSKDGYPYSFNAVSAPNGPALVTHAIYVSNPGNPVASRTIETGTIGNNPTDKIVTSRNNVLSDILNSVFIYCLRIDKNQFLSTATISINGQPLEEIVSTEASSVWTNFQFGYLGTLTSDAPTCGTLGEVIVYDAYLTGAEIASTFNYLSNKWIPVGT